MQHEMDSTARVRRYVNDIPRVQLHELREEARAESSRRLASIPPERAERADASTLPSAASFFVPSLPGIPDLASHPTHPLNVYAGLLPSYPGEHKGGGEGRVGMDATIFFMMVRARRNAGKQRVIFWFNGGPGCSSFDGSLMEVGPFRTVPAAKTASGKTELKLVEGGWEEFATIVFIDQPPGTGLSTVPVMGYLTELTEASQHLIEFMVNFYQVFPEYLGQDTYLAGESYAGQYIPYFADALLKTNRLPGVNLRGLAIGNGWIDPIRQYPAYAEFAYTKELIKKGTDAAKELDAEVDKCQQAIAEYTDESKVPVNIGQCEGIMGKVTAPFKQEINGIQQCMNVYDVRLVDTYPACGMNWPPDLTDVYSFLGRMDVVESLHAKQHSASWVECNGRVGNALRNHNSSASVHLIPGIIEQGVKVMMFAGAEDLICNYVGIERMIDAMQWNGEKGFGNATAVEWSMNKTVVGEWTEARNMTYVKVLHSSHMVGFDVPKVTNDMIMRFMDVDMKLVPGEMANAGSAVGDDERLPVHFGELKEDKGVPLLKGGAGDWESWYNAVSAVLILCTLIGIVGVYLFFRRRRVRRARGGALSLPLSHLRNASGERAREQEERVPLAAAAEEYELDDGAVGGGSGASTARVSRSSSWKGKGRAKEPRDGDDDESDAERGNGTVFALGDEDEH